MIADIKAFAKVNLHLEVLNKRADGYHNIFSLMASIDVFDLLKLEEFELFENTDQPVEIEVRVKNSSLRDQMCEVPDAENLICKAAKMYFQHAGLSGRAVISIEKNIPLGGGLGGGSSDAAATLKLINHQVKRYNVDTLRSIASKLGADVAYCIAGGWAICEGIGDVIESIPGSPQMSCLIINNGIHVDTARAYRLLNRDEQYVSSGIFDKRHRIKEFLNNNNFEIIHTIFQNDFEAPVFKEHPDLEQIKNTIYKEGALYVTMTGSGSSIVGIFENKPVIQQAYTRLQNSYKHVFIGNFA